MFGGLYDGYMQMKDAKTAEQKAQARKTLKGAVRYWLTSQLSITLWGTGIRYLIGTLGKGYKDDDGEITAASFAKGF